MNNMQNTFIILDSVQVLGTSIYDFKVPHTGADQVIGAGNC